MNKTWLRVGRVMVGIGMISGLLWWGTWYVVFQYVAITSACGVLAIAICGPSVRTNKEKEDENLQANV